MPVAPPIPGPTFSPPFLSAAAATGLKPHKGSGCRRRLPITSSEATFGQVVTAFFDPTTNRRREVGKLYCPVLVVVPRLRRLSAGGANSTAHRAASHLLARTVSRE